MFVDMHGNHSCIKSVGLEKLFSILVLQGDTMGFFENITRLTFLIICLLFDHKSLAMTPQERYADHAANYLYNYGHAGPDIQNLLTSDLLRDVLKDFQRFAGLDVTGTPDEATLSMFAKPRCAVKDQVGYGGYNRKKRYVVRGNRWHMNNLTYRIRNYPQTMNEDLVDSEIARAFQVWSEVTRIDFTKDERVDEEPHITIRFVEDDYGGQRPFDGVDGDLGYAFFPECGGHIYFDDEETWTAYEFRGKNLFQMAVHMIGHSLGLEHSDVPGSVMSPFYHRYEPRTQLTEDDKVGIQSLYGLRTRIPLGTRPRYPNRIPEENGPNLCEDPSIDAATIVDDGRAFFFKGNYYWQIQETGIVYGPRKISDDWGDVPGPIDAALTWNDGKTYLFKGDVLYRFKNQEREHGYPKQIEEVFPGIPSDLDAAFVYSGNGRIYFFKGDKYWRYESCQDPAIIASFYPHAISNWNSLPNDMDAALTWKNQKTYYFKGETYYKYDDKTSSVIESNSTSMNWFRCPKPTPKVDCDC